MEKKRYLKWYNKVGYGSGDLAGNVVYAFLSSFVMLYLTNTVGLNPGIIGTLIMVSKLFDGISDMFFGTMIDKTKSKLGKARPWMLYAYIGCAVTLVANFAIPDSLGTTAQYAWFFIAYTLLNAVFFTANNIAYASLVTFCTKNSRERVEMGSWRFIFAFSTSLLIQSVTVQFVRAAGGGAGTTSVLKRLFSLANVFSAEIEFETVLNRDYSLKEIVLNVYREHSDTNSGVGEYRNDIVLRYGKGITGIRKTTDAEKLYTCIQPTGKDGLTINGLDKKEYDENGNIEYFTDGALIRAPQARDRFPSNIVNKDDAYIMLRKEYDTDNQDKLYSMALSDLKTASEPVVTYEVDGYFDTNIGDTVRMQDQEWTPVLYLQARVSEQVRSTVDCNLFSVKR